MTALVVWLAALAAAVYTSNAQDASMDRMRVVSAARTLMPRPIGLKADPAPAETHRRIANTLGSFNEKRIKNWENKSRQLLHGKYFSI